MVTMEKFGKLCKEKMMEEVLLRFTKHPNFVITSFMGTSTANLENLEKSNINSRLFRKRLSNTC